MKNTVQAHRKGGTRKSSSQPKTPARDFQAACTKAARNPEIYLRVPGVGSVHLPQKMVAKIKTTAEKWNDGLDKFWEQAVEPIAVFKTEAEFVIHNKDSHPACLAIFDRLAGKPAFKIDLSEAEFDDLMTRTKNAKDGGSKFIADAIRHAVAAPEESGLTELELATAQANALMTLLVDKFDHIANRAGGEFRPGNDELIFGLSELAIQTQARLNGANKTVQAAIHPRR